MSNGSWRVVAPNGTVQTVDAEYIRRSMADGVNSARMAVTVAAVAHGWSVAEIVAPGEETNSERVALIAEREHALVVELFSVVTSVHDRAATMLRLRDGMTTFSAIEAKRVAERDGLRAIIEGRTVAPTDAEVAEHAAHGGLWRTTYVTIGMPGLARDMMDGDTATTARDMMSTEHTYTWWSVDASGRPCAWPMVAP